MILFETPALPNHLVMEDHAGKRWLVPRIPMSPEALALKKPYAGDTRLTRVRPVIASLYNPKVRKVRPLFVTLRVSPSELEDLDRRAADMGMTRASYMRRMLLLGVHRRAE